MKDSKMFSLQQNLLQMTAFLLLPIRLTIALFPEYGPMNRPNNDDICLNALGKDNHFLISFFGDLICDDELNIEDCEYDGGDCCRGIQTITVYCAICKCHLEVSAEFNGTQHVKMEYLSNFQFAIPSSFGSNVGEITATPANKSMKNKNKFKIYGLEQNYEKNSASASIFNWLIDFVAVVLSFDL